MSRLKITIKPSETAPRKVVPGQSTTFGGIIAKALAKAENERMQTEEFWHEVWSK